MNKTIITIIVLLVIIGGGIILYTNKPSDNPSAPTNLQTQLTGSGEPVNDTAVKNESAQGVKEFTIIGTSFSFNPNTITVNKGDTVKITFKDNGGLHNLTIDGYNVFTQSINTGGEATIQFVADKVGSFEYYCSVDSHKSRGMVGTLIVR